MAASALRACVGRLQRPRQAVVDDIGGAQVLPVPDDPVQPDQAAADDAGFDPLFGPLNSLVDSGLDGPTARRP